jgi:hypothetical protein
MSNYIVPKDEWAKFGNQCYAYLNSISSDFKYKLQKADDKNIDDPLEYRKLATPIIAMFIAFGVSERDIMEERYKMAMKPHTRQTSLNYLKAKGYSQVRMIKMIVDNWIACPQMIRDLLRKYNTNFIFPNDPPVAVEDVAPTLAPVQAVPVVPAVAPQPAYQQQYTPVAQAPSYANPITPPTQAMIDRHQPAVQPAPAMRGIFIPSMRDRAIAKYLKEHLIDYMGYNSQDALKRLFGQRGATDFVFNGRYDEITLEDFNRIRFSIIDYGKANFKDMAGLETTERVYYGKFKQILERFVQVLYFEPAVVAGQTQAPAPAALPPQPQTPVSQEPVYAPEPVQIQQNLKPTPPISEIVTKLNNNPPTKVSPQTAQMIELLVDEMSVSQIRLGFALLQDASSLQEFSDAIARKFAQQQTR